MACRVDEGGNLALIGAAWGRGQAGEVGNVLQISSRSPFVLSLPLHNRRFVPQHDAGNTSESIKRAEATGDEGKRAN